MFSVLQIKLAVFALYGNATLSASLAISNMRDPVYGACVSKYSAETAPQTPNPGDNVLEPPMITPGQIPADIIVHGPSQIPARSIVHDGYRFEAW